MGKIPTAGSVLHKICRIVGVPQRMDCYELTQIALEILAYDWKFDGRKKLNYRMQQAKTSAPAALPPLGALQCSAACSTAV